VEPDKILIDIVGDALNTDMAIKKKGEEKLRLVRLCMNPTVAAEMEQLDYWEDYNPHKPATPG